MFSGLFQSYYSKFNMGGKSDLRHKTSVPVPSNECKLENDHCESHCSAAQAV